MSRRGRARSPTADEAARQQGPSRNCAVREATRRAHADSQAAEKPRFAWFKRATSNLMDAPTPKPNIDRRLSKLRQSRESFFRAPDLDVESFGLIALALFGVALIVLGGSLLFAGNGDVIELIAGGAVAAPGVAAVLMAALGFRRPQPA